MARRKKSFTGSLRDRVNILTDAASMGAYEPDFTGTPLAEKVPADVVCVKGAEPYKDRQLTSHTDYVVTTRAQKRSTAQDRIEVTGGNSAGVTLEIVNVIQQCRGNHPARTEFYCVEVI